MKVGIIVAADDPMRLYAAATYAATELARGNEVGIFVTGRAVPLFAKGDHGDYPERRRMEELGVTWAAILKEAKQLGLAIAVCETVAKIYGLGLGDFKALGIVDEVTSMYTFLEKFGEKVVVF
ncbi:MULTISPECIES: DsrE family protein [Pyrobaculum]|mgnify:CR=1 FL=1|uniref:Uncharacterized protein n=1 Tax=Pyrobaculum arsenaticum (strain DSM 13514 / JCM 11321 / PZ6) TaxID=340102 RepID=A4WK58_PYRAR|nr:DsrE family protein [Pyrobaculum arsenaticum]ABP50775.1 conserved hypothetical protein [Pyrobaculum arsenaticum DSM 13514]